MGPFGTCYRPACAYQRASGVDWIELPQLSYLFHAARADLLRRPGRHAEAAAAYRAALDRVGNQAERRFLERRLASIEDPARRGA